MEMYNWTICDIHARTWPNLLPWDPDTPGTPGTGSCPPGERQTTEKGGILCSRMEWKNERDDLLEIFRSLSTQFSQ